MLKTAMAGVSALALAAALTTAAHADEIAAASTAVAGDVDAIIVTGTRSTTRTVLNSLAPIDVIPAAELQNTGKVSPRDLIAALVPSANTSYGGAGASFAVKTTALRGLGADQTLVLVNGKRRHNTAMLFVNGTVQSGQSPTDLDLIPSAAISRIEVLRDGASAQYGSDALAGVINIILKDTDTGGSATVLGGRNFDRGGDTLNLTGNVGLKLGNNGRLNLTAEARSQDRTERGGPNTSQLYFPINGQPDPREATANRYTSKPGQPASRLYSFGYDATLPLSERVELYGFGTATSRDTAAFLSFRNPNATNNNVQVYPNGYLPELVLKDRDFQHVLGLRGDELLGLKWDLSTSFARDWVDYSEAQSLNASLGPASPRDFYLGRLGFQEWTTNLDLSREVATGAFSTPLLVAAGLEHRADKFSIAAGEPASYADGGYVAPSGPLAGKANGGGAQGVSGFPAATAGAWSRHNVGAYLNLEQSLTSQWDFSLAGRAEHYSDFGGAVTGKASLRYQPTPVLAVRGTLSNGFRAPSLQQEHYASSSTTPVVINGQTTTVQYPIQLLPPDYGAAKALGAEPLKPEKSVNVSLGLVLRPLANLSATVDAYQIRIDDRIFQTGTLGPNATVSAALAAQGLNPQQAGYYYANAADTRTRGVDIVVDYRTNLGDFGQVKWTASANFNKTVFLRVKAPPAALAAAGLVLLDRARIGDFTVGTPKDKFILNADWQLSRFEANLRLTRYGEVQTLSATTPALDELIHPRLLVDLDVTYGLTDKLKLTVGANNLLNAYPDKLKPGNQGATGFVLYNSASPYALSGGFYYTRLSYAF